jgi:Kef-type K+ transport system membrane component KefB
MDWHRVGRQVLFLLLFATAAYGYRQIMLRLAERDRWYVGLIWLCACAYAADWSGLHFMVGAFLAGAVTDRDWFDRARMDLLRQHLLLVVMPVFFLSTGLRTAWSVGGAEVFAAAVLLLLASVTGKLIGVGLAGRILQWERGAASLIGWLLQTKALIMIIFVDILLDKQIVSSATFTALLLMAVVSTMLTVPVTAPRLEKLRATVLKSS